MTLLRSVSKLILAKGVLPHRAFYPTLPYQFNDYLRGKSGEGVLIQSDGAFLWLLIYCELKIKHLAAILLVLAAIVP